MLKELKELKKISNSQKDMTNMLNKILEEVTRYKEVDVYEKHKYYNDLNKDEINFFIDSVFNIIEDQLENDFKNILDIGFHTSGKKEYCNIYLDLDQDVPKSDMSNLKTDEISKWVMHIKLTKNSNEISLEIKEEDMVLQCDDIEKINKAIKDLKQCYNNIKKTYVINIFDEIIKGAKLSRSEFLNNLELTEDE